MDPLEICLDDSDRQHLVLIYTFQGEIEELILTLEEQTQKEEEEVKIPIKRVPVINRARSQTGKIMTICRLN
jgi:hypothetical protein